MTNDFKTMQIILKSEQFCPVDSEVTKFIFGVSTTVLEWVVEVRKLRPEVVFEPTTFGLVF